MGDSQLPGGSSSLPLALRPAPAAADGDESLIMQLSRISNQFGQFRHMDEDKLKEMVAAHESGLADVEDSDDEDDAADDAKKRGDELRDAKADMFKHIKYVFRTANRPRPVTDCQQRCPAGDPLYH